MTTQMHANTIYLQYLKMISTAYFIKPKYLIFKAAKYMYIVLQNWSVMILYSRESKFDHRYIGQEILKDHIR